MTENQMANFDSCRATGDYSKGSNVAKKEMEPLKGAFPREPAQEEMRQEDTQDGEQNDTEVKKRGSEDEGSDTDGAVTMGQWCKDISIAVKAMWNSDAMAPLQTSVAEVSAEKGGAGLQEAV